MPNLDNDVFRSYIYNDPSSSRDNFLAQIYKSKILDAVKGQGNFGVAPEDKPLKIAPIPVVPIQNTLTASPQTEGNTEEYNALKKLAMTPPPDSHSKYWGKNIIGKMPRDRFVQSMGMLANVLSPKKGIGDPLLDVAGGAYNERMKREYEESGNALKRRLLTAQIEHEEAAAKDTAATTKAADLTELLYQDEAGVYQWGLFDKKTGALVKPIRKATPKDVDFKEGAEKYLPGEEDRLAFENIYNIPPNLPPEVRASLYDSPEYIGALTNNAHPSLLGSVVDKFNFNSWYEKTYGVKPTPGQLNAWRSENPQGGSSKSNKAGEQKQTLDAIFKGQY